MLRCNSCVMFAEFSILFQSTHPFCMATVIPLPCSGGDKDAVLAAVRQCRCLEIDIHAAHADRFSNCCFQHADHELRADEEFVLKAVQEHVPVWRHAAPELRANRKVAMEAVRLTDGHVLRHVLPEHACDKEVVLASGDPLGLLFVDKVLRGDKDVVLAAVGKWGLDLDWATPELKADKDVVLAAVSNDGEALQYASPDLKVGATEIYTTTGGRGPVAGTWASPSS